MSEVQKIIIQTRAPKGKDAGKVAIGYYVVADSFVVLTDETGKPDGDSRRYLVSDGDARLMACQMLKSQQNARGQSGVFSAPIRYPKIGY